VFPEENRRGAFECPGFQLFLILPDLNEQVNVRIPPVESLQRTGSRETLVEVENRGHTVVRPRRTHHDDNENACRADTSLHDNAPAATMGFQTTREVR
jgi:hypothetical protein